MALNIFLIFIFFASAFAVWYRVSQKIPELVAVQDQVIAQRLHEDSARLRIFLLHLRTFYKEAYYRGLVWRFLGKFFYRIHIVLLRFDNAIVKRLKIIRNKGGFSPLTPSFLEPEPESEIAPQPVVAKDAKSHYWHALKQNKSSVSAKSGYAVEGLRRRQRRAPIKPNVPE